MDTKLETTYDDPIAQLVFDLQLRCVAQMKDYICDILGSDFYDETLKSMVADKDPKLTIEGLFERFERLDGAQTRGPDMSALSMLICMAMSVRCFKALERGEVRTATLSHAECRFFLGLAMGAAEVAVEARRSVTGVARKAADAKLENDPKQAWKDKVKALWTTWEKMTPEQQRAAYKKTGAAAFCRAMQDKFPGLESTKNMEVWCTEWKRENTQ